MLSKRYKSTETKLYAQFQLNMSNHVGEKSPREGPGVKSRMCPPYPHRVVKGD